MNAIKAVYHNGQIIPREPVDWPEGTELSVEPLLPELVGGTPEEGWPTDPESIARRLALMDEIEPLEMTPEEEAEWGAARVARNELGGHDLGH